MNNLPVGVGIKGLLHGFSALYGLFSGGFLLVFAMSFFLSGVLQLAVMLVGLVGFLAFAILGVVLKIQKPDIFLVKEEHRITITLEGSKIPNGEIVTEITKLDKPRQHPLINNQPKKMGEQ